MILQLVGLQVKVNMIIMMIVQVNTQHIRKITKCSHHCRPRVTKQGNKINKCDEIIGPKGKKGCRGYTGPIGPTGPAGMGDACDCGCVNQIRNVLQQATGAQLNVSTTATNFSYYFIVGVTGMGNPASDSVVVINDGFTGPNININVCDIESLQFSSPNNSFEQYNFINEPIPPPTGCEAYCEKSLRNMLTNLAGDNLSYKFTTIGGSVHDPITIADIKYGATIFGGGTDILNKSDLLISTCKISSYSLSV